MMIFVKPKQGLRVRHPEKKDFVLPPEGCEVMQSKEWLRLIKSGDVDVVAGELSHVEDEGV